MNIVIMVSDGYPFKFTANNSKGEFIALGLKECNCSVTMIDTMHGSKGFSSIKKGISSKGIPYIIFPRIGKYSSFLHNIPNVWSTLKMLKNKNDNNHLLLGMMDYPLFIIVAIMAMMLGYKRSTLFHEWHIGINHSNIFWKVEAYLKDKTFGYFLNAIFPIGHFLQEKALKFKKPMILVPVLAKFDRKVKNISHDHFTYCGHAAYLLRNSIVIDAFESVVKKYHNAKLVLVLVGTESQKIEVQKLLEKKCIENSVQIKSNISQDELYSIYDSSIGLLIPLDPNNIQDKARFSQKIAEYVASHRPIITSNVGEIPYYFTNNESAIIVPFTAEGYEEGMLSLINDMCKGNIIGENGYHIGLCYFDYIKEGKRIKNFILNL